MIKRIRRTNIAFGLLIGWSIFASLVALRGQGVSNRRTADVRSTFVRDWRKYGARGFSRGPDRAVTTVVVFGDFQCPFCRRFAPVIDSLHVAHPDVRIVERHFPLKDLHPAAFAAALAAECAKDEGLYEKARDVLYSEQVLLEANDWAEIGKKTGVGDPERFATCVKSQQHIDVVNADISDGMRLGVPGTPAVLYNDTLLSHTPTLGELESRLRQQVR